MTIRREDVLHVARLAEMGVSEAELPTLVVQLDRIVAFVSQLDRLPAAVDDTEFLAGPAATPLRADEVRSVPLTHPIESFAPELGQQLFLVPRHGAMEEE